MSCDVQYRRLSPWKAHLLLGADTSSLPLKSSWSFVVTIRLATAEEMRVVSGKPR